jgi:hypothetical protein
MTKKKTARPGFQMTIRLTDDEERRFRAVATEEGFSSIQQWFMEQGTHRATIIETAIAEKRFTRVRGKLIPLSDFPDGKPPK